MEDKKLTLDGVEYSLDSLSELGKLVLRHINAVDVKMEELTFDLDELKVARTGFINMLKIELESETESK